MGFIEFIVFVELKRIKAHGLRQTVHGIDVGGLRFEANELTNSAAYQLHSFCHLFSGICHLFSDT